MANWMQLSPMGRAMPGSPVQGGGNGGSTGGGAQALLFRDSLDASRAQQGARIPGATYPDGYLGTIQSRREDRMLDQLSNRSAQRSSQRGVHKGERIDPADYIDPPELSPWRGLQRQAAGVPQPDGTVASLRAAPMMTLSEQLQAHGDRLPMSPRGRLQPLVPEGAPDALRQAMLTALLPSWRV